MIEPKHLAALRECEYKAILMMEDVSPPLNSPRIVRARERERLVRKEQWLGEKKQGGGGPRLFSSFDQLQELNHALYGTLTLLFGGFQCEVDGMELTKDRGNGTGYMPVVVSSALDPTKEDKMRLAFAAFIIEGITGFFPKKGVVIAGPGNRFPVTLSSLRKKVEGGLARLSVLARKEKETFFFLNRHCGSCVYSAFCRKKALGSGHLSLLQGMSAGEIRKQNSRGIFTVDQYSYTFQPRKERKGRPVKSNHALRALAVRERKTYVVHRPEMPEAETFVFFDVEGMPERDFFT